MTIGNQTYIIKLTGNENNNYQFYLRYFWKKIVNNSYFVNTDARYYETNTL